MYLGHSACQADTIPLSHCPSQTYVCVNTILFQFGDPHQHSHSSHQENTFLSTPLITIMHTHLFPQEIFPEFLPKVLHILKIPFSKKEAEEPDPSRPAGSARAFPQRGYPPLRIPFPSVFDKMVKVEWETLARTKTIHSIISHFCHCPQALYSKFTLLYGSLLLGFRPVCGR